LLRDSGFFRELREIGAGVTITPNAMHALNFLGVGERVANEAGPTEAYLIRHFQTGAVIKIRASGTDYAERFGANYHQVHRADLHAALADAVLRNDSNCVFLDHRFESLTQDSKCVAATFTNGKTIASDVLIGCDGGTSKVRACVFGDEVVNYTGQVAFRALLPMANIPSGITKIPFAMFVGIKRVMLHYPLRHRTIMNVISVAREPRWQEEGWTIPATVEELTRLRGHLFIIVGQRGRESRDPQLEGTQQQGIRRVEERLAQHHRRGALDHPQVRPDLLVRVRRQRAQQQLHHVVNDREQAVAEDQLARSVGQSFRR